MKPCPVPGCEQEPPKGCVFCADHYFALSRSRASQIHSVHFAMIRADEPEIRDHLAHQLRGYISIAINEIAQEACHA